MNPVGLKSNSQLNRTNPSCFASLYRNLQKRVVMYDGSVQDDQETPSPAIVYFDLNSFEKEVQEAKKVSQNIIIGGDWNAHHPAWNDDDVDHIGENILDFINNNMHILNSSSFRHTFEKHGDGGRISLSSIDITLCSSSLYQFCSNWRTDNEDLNVRSDHLPMWASPRIS